MKFNDNRPLPILLGIFLLLWAGSPWAGMVENRSPGDGPGAAPIYFYASQSGKKTLDKGSDGGNPFAGALIELLDRPDLGFGEFSTGLMELTAQKSKGFQQPDVSAASIRDVLRLCALQLAPKPAAQRRVALVLVFSDYSGANLPPLPGARGDMKRIADALQRAGFDEVRKLIDPNHGKLESAMREFTELSQQSDLAVLYATGHGIEVEGNIYLIPGHHPFLKKSTMLEKRTVPLTRLGNAPRASHANIIFYGGSRETPFSDD
uniref:Caspase domain-containing protein n=1 Tax=Candidatus Kentrum sp. FW TaxID=2126338 RepID=A0A450TLR4_9GAMM|nr:MAG: Caspase domain-containing protein [Candidatus Kentron sp. FW]VFJ68642.1 MAG: Caspase domain-containing protein [Candidatus Kentron sp. FW]